ncbi:MAG: adenylate/guanylate cyclase domain-containing protein [Actinomycetota bacterium]
MARLPTGTVTFLFSDIEGSTKLLQKLNKEYFSVLEEHSALLRETFDSHNGKVVSTEGDSFFVVFASALQAVEAAATAQRTLREHPWKHEVEIKVRMGLHSGEGILGGDNYVGLDVHRAARIMSSGYGGQVLISDSTRALVHHDLTGSLTLKDLGEHHLKDLAKPERLFQLVADDLPAEFPAIKSIGGRPNNLPTQLTSFVGRQSELVRLGKLLRTTRCLTLTGPGGTGKTRLSLELAREAAYDFENGTFFVPLASVTDPNQIAAEIASTLGLRETRGETRTPQERLIGHIGPKQMLLVLDNFEQVVVGASVVSDLLKNVDGLKVVVTTRIPLHIQGEQEYPVQPLPLPDPQYPFDAELLSQYESIALFIERAVTVRPDFQVTNQNAPAIAEICARLDGLPLAIELAAARVRVLSPEALLARLGDRLKLLVGGSRESPERQKTLRGTIEWSYDLLDEQERKLLRQVSVFTNGCRLEEAEIVCVSDDLGTDVFDGLSSLVDKSLVKIDESAPAETRFFMLETIREYALERLRETEEDQQIHQRHAAAYVDLAEQAQPHLVTSKGRAWLDQLDRDNDNLRAAHAWAVTNEESDMALRMVVALWRFWHMRGYLQEGRRRAEESLAMPGAQQQTPLRAKALQAIGGISHWQAEIDSQRAYYEEALALWEKLGDEVRIADALYDLAFPEYMGGDFETAQMLAERTLQAAERVGDPIGIANAKWLMAVLFAFGTSPDRAAGLALLNEALETYRAEDNVFMQIWVLYGLGNLALHEEKIDQAEDHFHEGLRLASKATDITGVLFHIDNLSLTAKAHGKIERAIRLASVAAGLKASSGTELVEISRELYGFKPVGEEGLTEEHLQDLWTESEKWSLDEAIAYAMEGS